MGLFDRLFQALQRQSLPHQPHPAASSQAIPPPPPPHPSRPKTLQELEQELEAEAQRSRPSRQSTASAQSPKRLGVFQRLTRTALLMGVPLGVIGIANLPIELIRRPIAEKAPVLLLPSRISQDYHFRHAIAAFESAKQLIDRATSIEDLQLAERKLAEAQASLDELPISPNDEWIEENFYDGWYDWQFSVYAFNRTRAEVGRLQAKLFQEKNAKTALEVADQELGEAKQRYNSATSLTDKQQAVLQWRSALNQLEQIPAETLAARAAQPKLRAAQQELVAIAGAEAGESRSVALINAAKQYAWQAAQRSQNPPHSMERWQEVETLWQEAIEPLQRVTTDDITGYAEAQKLLAAYKTNLGQIQSRQAIEAKSAAALRRAQALIQEFQAVTPDQFQERDRNITISRIQGIFDELEQVKPGTTGHAEAQKLMQSAQRKLDELRSS